MKIASYNLWESDAGMPERLEQIIEEVTSCRADIFCLQEVSRPIFDLLTRNFPYFHLNEPSGTALLSRYPLDAVNNSEFSVSATISVDGISLRIVSLHLPWKSASERERAIVWIVRENEEILTDYTLLAGDFNCSEQSAVHHFLIGEQSLHGADAFFFDLAEAWSEHTGSPPSVTLDFRNNPRWGIVDPPNTIQKSVRYDRILIKNPYPQDFPVLQSFERFGTKSSPVTRLCASDHYGVAAELIFP
ncbi:MAG: endonuclease/exonuclease/phosphatase family protein [Clostridia bacterium]|nr:endonuclease/exonuclease/phosphatase family protein [Clostridia bacterium]